ncbi:MAG: hypothetical protein M3127_02495 [Actinomycetota bacterium]|nr:hypothetical protein [Actinomycetota bacterium]
MAETDKNRPDPSSPVEQEQSRGLRRALAGSEIGIGDLWLRYFSIGGKVGEYEVDAYIQSLLSLPPIERDLLAHAANELIDELPPRLRAPYMDETVRGGQPAGEHPRLPPEL